MNTHPSFYTTIDGVLFVEKEIVTGLGPQQDEDFLQGALILLYEGKLRLGNDQGVTKISDNFAGDLLHRSDDIGESGPDRTARHAVKFGGYRILHQHHSRFLLDRFQPQSAVGTHTGKDDPDTPCLSIFGQRAKEEIDGEA